MATYGIQTFDNVGVSMFSTDEKLFRYLGYKDLKLGDFSIPVTLPFPGKLVAIPILLLGEHPKGAAPGVNVSFLVPVYFSKLKIVGNTITGELKSASTHPSDLYFGRVHYGVYQV